MVETIENRMVVDAAWNEDDSRYDDLPRCECCEEKNTAVSCAAYPVWKEKSLDLRQVH